jgi:hypothetical protein
MDESLLTITDGTYSFEIDRKTSIMIELKLNISKNGRCWSHIGDALFNFGTKKDLITVLSVTTDQYQYLHMLHVC